MNPNSPLCPGSGGAGIYIDWCIIFICCLFQTDIVYTDIKAYSDEMLKLKNSAKVFMYRFSG